MYLKAECIICFDTYRIAQRKRIKMADLMSSEWDLITRICEMFLSAREFKVVAPAFPLPWHLVCGQAIVTS